MKFRDSATIACPYCGQKIIFDVDPSVPLQDYVEDCQVCCRPIFLTVVIDAKGRPHITARREDD
ncbi:CPXCG motif-containing cysteine-rich protein [candidate division KSB1 bacterium]|nr:CPXCG motif-containing cysteine-rich protein [candidate division KSB1 bacterium]RQW06238.1 MAG: CPXCG motif-containing cysteine-rich protein [candidate division KSB1 bacterium]